MQVLNIHTLNLNELPTKVIDALLDLSSEGGIDIIDDMGIFFYALDFSNEDERILGDFLFDNYKGLISNTIFVFSN